jgi:hypothetical protein
VSAEVLRTAHQVASNALHWLQRSAPLGALPTGATVDLADPENPYKPLGETALAASLVLREGVAGPGDLQAARDLLAFAWQEFDGGDVLYERQLRHPMLTDPLETYAHFVRGGYRHRPLGELVGHLGALGSVGAIEMMPNRRLAVANAHRVVDPGHRSDWTALTAACWLGATPEPWMIDWMTAYHMTHTVFHVTDWGAHPAALPSAIADYLRLWLPVWIDIWQEVGQWDLVGELLIVDACLEEPVCDAQGWDRLARAQHADGLLPRDAEPVDEDPVRAFKDNEHTAVVAIVAGTVTLARELGVPAADR